MNKLLVGMAIAGVAGFLFKGGLGSHDGGTAVAAFDAGGQPVVWVFTVEGCGATCDSVTKRLDAAGVAYVERKVNPADRADPNTVQWEKMGRDGFPVIVAGNEKIVGPSQARLAGLLGKNFGDEYLSRAEQHYFREHFYSDGSPKIVLYGASWCGYCKKLREEFAAAQVDYLDIDVEKSRNPKQMSSVMEINGYPTVYVGYRRVEGTRLRDVKQVLEKG